MPDSTPSADPALPDVTYQDEPRVITNRLEYGPIAFQRVTRVYGGPQTGTVEVVWTIYTYNPDYGWDTGVRLSDNARRAWVDFIGDDLPERVS